MLGKYMTLGALALGAANALDLRWTYPNCVSLLLYHISNLPC
jgi:hypothetical protein